MSYEVKILADSTASNVRLSTLQCTYPRMVHSEAMTHRVFSRNAASSRAIPIEKMLERVRLDPVMPVWWGKNQRGMQAEVELVGDELERAKREWLSARDAAVSSATKMLACGMHKQLVNRVVEPWMWITSIITSTEWENFFNLRISPEAQPEIRRMAEMMRTTLDASKPVERGPGQWHKPLVYYDDVVWFEALPAEQQIALGGYDAVSVKLSVARCARVAYLTHEGKRDVDADLALYDRLLKSGHMSPFEHAAMVHPGAHLAPGQEGFDYENLVPEFIGNFRRPWVQHRKQLPGEDVFHG